MDACCHCRSRGDLRGSCGSLLTVGDPWPRLQTQQEEPMPKGYWIARVDITDQEK
jgi:hypothetical protein